MKECPHRHPRPCKFFTLTGSCFFGSMCSFSRSHSITPPRDDTPTPSTPSLEEFILLQQQVAHLSSLIACISKRLDEISLSKSQPEAAPPLSFPCTQCEYLSSTSKGLNAHISKKHKVDILRENPSPDIADLPLPVIHRNCPAPSPSIPLESISTLPHNASLYPVPELPFPNQGIPNLKCDDCENVFTNSHDHGNHLLQAHNLSSPCTHCDTIVPEQDELLLLHRDWCPVTQCPGSLPCSSSLCFIDEIAEDVAKS